MSTLAGRREPCEGFRLTVPYVLNASSLGPFLLHGPSLYRLRIIMVPLHAFMRELCLVAMVVKEAALAWSTR